LQPAAISSSAQTVSTISGLSHAGQKQSDIASGGPEAQLGGLEQLDGHALLGQPINRRHAHDAAADDDHIRRGLGLK
jgi:hypothetical protein